MDNHKSYVFAGNWLKTNQIRSKITDIGKISFHYYLEGGKG